jgi:hypothetical protein
MRQGKPGRLRTGAAREGHGIVSLVMFEESYQTISMPGVNIFMRRIPSMTSTDAQQHSSSASIAGQIIDSSLDSPPMPIYTTTHSRVSSMRLCQATSFAGILPVSFPDVSTFFITQKINDP